MKATFDFIPAHCPNCGTKLFQPGSSSDLGSLKANLDDFHAGQPFHCFNCGLFFSKARPGPDWVKWGIAINQVRHALKAIKAGERDTQQGLIDIARDVEALARLLESERTR